MSFKTIGIGGTTSFTVVARNAEGDQVPDNGITVSVDNPSVATATVSDDGSSGIVTGVAFGSYNVTATDASGVTSPMMDGVVADLTVATLEIVPA